MKQQDILIFQRKLGIEATKYAAVQQKQFAQEKKLANRKKVRFTNKHRGCIGQIWDVKEQSPEWILDVHPSQWFIIL